MEYISLILSFTTLLLIGFITFKVFKKEDESDLSIVKSELKEKFATSLERLSSISQNIDTLSERTATMSIPIQNLNTYLGGNVTAGRLGEWNLESIVADVLPNTKFKTQFNLNPENNYRVDVAIKAVEGHYIPIDSKFYSQQYDNYQRATTAAERTASLNHLKTSINADAADIEEKYLLDGVTAGIGILYVPSEGLVAMVNLIDDLRESLLRKKNILILGPNSLAGFLDQIRMGHKVVMLNEAAVQVARAIGQVKREFESLELSTVELKSSINSMSNKIDKYQTRINVVTSKLNTAEREIGTLDETQ
jgi:DNA recombination protein RmuC